MRARPLAVSRIALATGAGASNILYQPCCHRPRHFLLGAPGADAQIPTQFSPVYTISGLVNLPDDK